jgi:hypothetical protein
MTPDGEMVSTKGSAASMIGVQHEFARYALAWLLRSTASVPLNFSYGGSEALLNAQHAVVQALGPDGFEARLYVREMDCLPSALAFRRPASMGDTLRDQAAGRTSTSSVRPEFLYLASYQRVESILFPREMRREVDGLVIAEQKVTDVRMNETLPSDFFSIAQRD